MSSSQLRDSILLPNWIPTVKSILFQRTKDKNNCLDMIKNQSKNTAYDLKLLRKKKKFHILTFFFVYIRDYYFMA